MMPVMDGIELCKRIKSDINLSHIPVILLTARTDTASKIAGLENGADVYIEKPVSVSYLYAQMVSLLENRNKLRCLFSEKPFTPINTLTETQADEKWFNRLNEIIQENISNTEFSVDQLTRSVNMSRTLLYAKVKAVTGLPRMNLSGWYACVKQRNIWPETNIRSTRSVIWSALTVPPTLPNVSKINSAYYPKILSTIPTDQTQYLLIKPYDYVQQRNLHSET